MTNLILCGGSGTRLWPLSRHQTPKQFYPLFAGQTLFEQTVLRNKMLADEFWVASNARQIDLAKEQLNRCGVTDFRCLVEPVGRNTTPAIALVCLALDPEELVFVTPSDHLITKAPEYRRAVARAAELAAEGYLVTFGIKPTGPETGFGYIEAQGETVVSFREKPDLVTAQGYVAGGKHFWNSGMFVFKAGAFLGELGIHAPEVLDACRRVGGVTPDEAGMRAIPAVSIDYAVMEKSRKVRVVSCDPGWSDLGSFDALYDEVERNETGNGVLTSVEPIFVGSKNNLVVGAQRKVALVDVEDLMVIDTPDALLIVRRGSSQKVKDVVDALRKGQDERLL